MKNYKICLDPGHGGSDPGAVGPTGLKESDIVWRIACMVADILIRYGIEIIFTRVGDTSVSLDKRVQIANDSYIDYFISIHMNSANNPTATGTETYAYAKGVEGDRLAHSIQRNLVSQLGLADRGVKYNGLQVTRDTTMPAVLTEIAFINNLMEEKLLKSDEFLERAAVGIAKGILEHLNIDFASKSGDENLMSWQKKQGLEHLDSLAKKKVIDTPDFWKEKMLEAMPVWAILSLIDRITDK